MLGSDVERAATYEGLASVASHLRSRVGRALRLRVAPELVFKQDQSVAHAARIESLLAGLRDEPSAPSGDEPASPSGDEPAG